MDKKLYIYGESLIEILPYFLYEIDVYKYWEQGACLLDFKTVKTGKPYALKCSKIITRYDNYIIEKSINLVGAPKDFIEDMHLVPYKKINGKRRKKKISKI